MSNPHPPENAVDVMGMQLASLTSEQLLTRVDQSLGRTEGGWIVTANLDILLRHVTDAHAAQVYAEATFRVADGMPLVWASRVQGQPLPERIAGSSFMFALCDLCYRRGLAVYLLGGAAGTAESAATVLTQRYEGLRVQGRSDLRFDATPNAAQLSLAADVLREYSPSVVLVGLGSPKQEHLISRLHTQFPNTWFVGVGGSFSFIAGSLKRAPAWAQAVGLEWAHRLSQEPRRLGKRYLVDNLPFFGRLMLSSLRRRFS